VSNNPLRFVDPSGHMQDSDEKYRMSNPFVYGQLEFMTKIHEASTGSDSPSESMRGQTAATANYLRYVADSGANYAILSLDTFLPVDDGNDPWGDRYLGNGTNRQFGVNDLNVKTLQYAVVNLDYNSVVGINYVTVTQRIDDEGNITKEKRDSNSGMYFTSNLEKEGQSNFTEVHAGTSARNELSTGSPSLDYSATIQISNKQDVSVEVTLDKFPSYEGYISINGGQFNNLYQLSAIPGYLNPFTNLAFSGGTFKKSFTYQP
jgi:hypothetical protein